MTLDVEALPIEGLKLIGFRRFTDSRGFFSELYNAPRLEAAGLATTFVQDNYAVSTVKGTVRGLHFQLPPEAQSKLVFVLQGRILDVAVDLREGSATYGRHFAVELDANHDRALFVPEGFAHGYCTCDANSAMLYKVSKPYNASLERGILWSDPQLAISWPDYAGASVSDRDAALPPLAAATLPVRSLVTGMEDMP